MRLFTLAGAAAALLLVTRSAGTSRKARAAATAGPGRDHLQDRHGL